MKRLHLTFILLASLFLASCSTVPLTGRKQMLLVSDSEVLSSSLTQYNDYGIQSGARPASECLLYAGRKDCSL